MIVKIWNWGFGSFTTEVTEDAEVWGLYMELLVFMSLWCARVYFFTTEGAEDAEGGGSYWNSAAVLGVLCGHNSWEFLPQRSRRTRRVGIAAWGFAGLTLEYYPFTIRLIPFLRCSTLKLIRSPICFPLIFRYDNS